METIQLKENINIYLNQLENNGKSARTITTYKNALFDFLDTLDSEQDVSTLSVIKWQNKLVLKGVKRNTIRHYLICLNAFYNWQVRNGLVAKNIINAQDLPKKEQIKYDLLSLEEIQQLLSYEPKTKTLHSKRNKAIITTLILTGARNEELRNIKLKDLDFEKSVICIQRGKGNKYREIPFPEQCKQDVINYLQDKEYPQVKNKEQYLFGYYDAANNWNQLKALALTHLVTNYVKKVTGHDYIGAHDLRHAFASLASNLGADTRSISLAMGHSSEQITNKIYISILDKSKAARNINTIFNGVKGV